MASNVSKVISSLPEGISGNDGKLNKQLDKLEDSSKLRWSKETLLSMAFNGGKVAKRHSMNFVSRGKETNLKILKCTFFQRLDKIFFILLPTYGTFLVAKTFNQKLQLFHCDPPLKGWSSNCLQTNRLECFICKEDQNCRTRIAHKVGLHVRQIILKNAIYL